MATGDVKWFSQGLVDLGNKLHNLSSDVLKLGIVNATTVPSSTTAAPHWGGTGTTNFATNQVGIAGTSYTGPLTLAAVTWSLNGGANPSIRASIISLAQDASGFTTGAYGIIYNSTDVNKRCLGWVEINAAATASLVAGPITIDWNGVNNDILQLTWV